MSGGPRAQTCNGPIATSLSSPGRSRGSLRNGPGALNPVFADTGTFLAESQDMAGAEVSLVLGSFQVQSEYIASSVIDARNTAGTVNYGTYFTNGYYVMASYWRAS